jgi:acyl carrier protein
MSDVATTTTTAVGKTATVDPALAAYVREREEVLERVQRTLIACLDLRRSPEEIDPDTVLFGTGLGLDSVDAVELVISLEMDFGIKLGDDDTRRRALRTVNSLVDTILAAKQTAPAGGVA